MKKKGIVLALVTALCTAALAGCGSSDSGEKLYLYNWTEYIPQEVYDAFEEETGIEVIESTFSSNEEMLAKLTAGGTDQYDMVVASNYVIKAMQEQGLIQELDKTQLENLGNISDTALGMDFDPENQYSIPYTWGTVGIIYNTKYVDEADVTGWELLWNEKYSGKILMFGNSRDAFGIAEYLLGYDVNTTDDTELQAAAQKLTEQKPLVQQYVMDEIFDLMENEEAWIAPYYAGDYLTMVAENEDLAFYHPSQGFNLFIDAMCIPSCCQNKEAAETFINFLCEPEIAGGNMDWIGYGTPESAAKEFIDPEMTSSTVAYPSDEVLSKGTSFLFLPADVNQRMEELWLQVKTD